MCSDAHVLRMPLQQRLLVGVRMPLGVADFTVEVERVASTNIKNPVQGCDDVFACSLVPTDLFSPFSCAFGVHCTNPGCP